jgi:hypothetical protein
MHVDVALVDNHSNFDGCSSFREGSLLPRTGATSFVGSRLTQRLLQEGMRVRALDRGPHPVAVAGVETAVQAGCTRKAVRELGYRPRVTYAEAPTETERYLTQSGLIKR